MSKLKRAQDHLQNVISRKLALFWESFALVTTMTQKYKKTKNVHFFHSEFLWEIRAKWISQSK